MIDLKLQSINTMTVLDATKAYVEAGFSLVPVLPKSKQVKVSGWNKDEFGWTPGDNFNGNIGARLYHSGIVTVDIDDKESFLKCMEAIRNYLPIEESPFWESKTAGITSGRKGSGKLVFQCPENVSLEYHDLKWKEAHPFELRCGTKDSDKQDLLPPSIHPEGKQYKWVGGCEILPMPKDLLELWVNFEKYETVMQMADPNYVPPKREYKYRKRDVSGIIRQWEDTQSLDTWLLNTGYKYDTDSRRYIAPESNSGSPGVVLTPDRTHFYSFHASDIMNDGKIHGAFDLLLKRELHDDWEEAMREIKKDLGIDDKQTVSPECECEYDFKTQQGFLKYAESLSKDKLIFDSDSHLWYKYDDFCYTETNEKEVQSLVHKTVRDSIESSDWDDSTKHKAASQNTDRNARAFTLFSGEYLKGNVDTECATVFDGGDTLVFTYDEETGKSIVEHRASPEGIKTTSRVHFKYADYTMADIPEDLRTFIMGYGDENRVKALLRMFGMTLSRKPEKVCFQFVGEKSNTGKSSLARLFLTPFDYVEMPGEEITTENKKGRMTLTVKAITHNAIVYTEVQGTIHDEKFKNLCDSAPDYTENVIYCDGVKKKRHASIFMCSNKRIRAEVTDAYAERAYPIEFETVFEQNSDYENLIVSQRWGQYVVGLLIHELFEYVEGRNQGKGIKKQMDELDPRLVADRTRLLHGQDYRISKLDAVIRHPPQRLIEEGAGGKNIPKLLVKDVYDTLVREYAGVCNIPEWGISIKPGDSKGYVAFVKDALMKDLRSAGYELYYGNAGVGKERRRKWFVINAEWTPTYEED